MTTKIGSSIVHTVVKTLTQPLDFRPGYGRSIGQFVDDFIREAIADGDEIGSLTINISPEDWQLLAKGLKDNQDVSVENSPCMTTPPSIGSLSNNGPKRSIRPNI